MIYVRKSGFVEPYSRWKITESMTTAGLERTKAYELALVIQREMKDKGIKHIDENDLRGIVIEKLKAIDPGTAEKYIIWNRIRHEKIPIIILIGGTSGIGKSSVALELAHRLGIKQVIGTDTIREIMRNMIAPNLLPEIHQSSYEAWKAISFKVKEDKVIVGFREQAKAVSAGINAAIERSLKEGISLVIEGVHMVPEFIPRNPNVVRFLLYLKDPETHISRFHSRASETHIRREASQYLESMDFINKIQTYLYDTAIEADISTIENKDFNKTISMIMDVTTKRMKDLLNETYPEPL